MSRGKGRLFQNHRSITQWLGHSGLLHVYSRCEVDEDNHVQLLLLCRNETFDLKFMHQDLLSNCSQTFSQTILSFPTLFCSFSYFFLKSIFFSFIQLSASFFCYCDVNFSPAGYLLSYCILKHVCNHTF